jgi:hypothetical protein
VNLLQPQRVNRRERGKTGRVVEGRVVHPIDPGDDELAEVGERAQDLPQHTRLDVHLVQLNDVQALPVAVHQRLQRLLAALVVLHLADVRASRLQLLSQQLARGVARVEAVRQVDVFEVRAARDGARQVRLRRLPQHVGELYEAHSLAEVLVAAHALAQLLQAAGGAVNLFAMSRLPSLFREDLLEGAVVDRIDANAVVSVPSTSAKVRDCGRTSCSCSQ